MPARQTVLVGDALTRLRELATGSVQVAVTSVPYFHMRDYGTATWTGGDPACGHKDAKAKGRYDYAMPASAQVTTHRAKKSGTDAAPWADVCPKCGARREDAQIGQEARPDCLGWATGNACGCCYVCHLVAVFREVRRVLRDDGVLFLNLGSSYAANRGYQVDGTKQVAGSQPNSGARVPTGYKPKDLILTPHLVALALQADGWWLRSEIVWSKLAPLPESVTDRPSRSHEQIFLFSKSERYYYDAAAVQEAAVGEIGGAPVKIHDEGAQGTHGTTNTLNTGWHVPATSRNQRDVWVLGPEPNLDQFCAACNTLYTGAERRKPGQPCRCGATDRWVAHFASFPAELPRRAILAGSSERGCCSACGAPWVRIVERTDRPAAGMRGSRFDAGKTGTRDGGDRTQPGPRYAKRAAGWRPGCACPGRDGDAPWPDLTLHPDGPANWPAVPCTILDPFVGSGTTLLVAQELGRAGIGIDLRPEYAALTQARLTRAGQQPALLLEVCDV